jgi:UDP-N-acetyl-D-mannosaminuronate dehydrogenase
LQTKVYKGYLGNDLNVNLSFGRPQLYCTHIRITDARDKNFALAFASAGEYLISNGHRGPMRIAVIGSGYVGLVSAACFAEIGHNVISVDNDSAKIGALERGEVPIHEQFLPELFERHRGHRLRFSTSVAQAVKQSDAIFITVGTPQSETGEADLSFVEAVAYEIAAAISEPTSIIEKSTVPVRLRIAW